MGRIRQTIQVHGQDCGTLFDTGARNTYITAKIASHLATSKVDRPFRTALGGGIQGVGSSKVNILKSANAEKQRVMQKRSLNCFIPPPKETTETALLEAEVEGRRISTHAMVIDDIGNDEDGAPIEILFGALAMQQWGIRLIPEQEKLDLSHYPEEFLEF
ncbi:MAG: hypothetical protein ACE5I1_10960 [bacterium]